MSLLPRWSPYTVYIDRNGHAGSFAILTLAVPDIALFTSPVPILQLNAVQATPALDGLLSYPVSEIPCVPDLGHAALEQKKRQKYKLL
jgi:hypothetical protein